MHVFVTYGPAAHRGGRAHLKTASRSVSAAPSRWLLVVVIITAITGVNAIAASAAANTPELTPTSFELVAETTLAVVAIGLLTAHRWWRYVGFRGPDRVGDFRLYWLLLIPLIPAAVAALASSTGTRPSQLVYLLVLASLIGFVEEVFFRGLILRALVPSGLWRAAIFSSTLFGAMHLLNLLFGAEPTATLLQAVYATTLGFGFAAVTLRTGMLWPVIVIHASIDFAGFVAADSTTAQRVGAGDLLVYVLYATLFSTYGIVLMRTAVRRRDALRVARFIPSAERADGRDHP
ncbi:lysostaphin resistance A-like protein [Herbiconiux sp. P15]|uniref:CPBP family intramembrane glutamic endopeptidase n=1 Tax=Herbiconiux liukaitaii TaxID=3342799 RepID=UPI0035B95A73